jgi:hypothetical protein
MIGLMMLAPPMLVATAVPLVFRARHREVGPIGWTA